MHNKTTPVREHNATAHSDILNRRTANNRPLFSDFRAPDVLSTYTWGDTNALDKLFDVSKFSSHNLLLVRQSAVPQLIDDIERTVLSFVAHDNDVGLLGGPNAAVCVAAWLHNGAHALVAVASSLNCPWRPKSAPPFDTLMLGGSRVCNTQMFNNLERGLLEGDCVNADLLAALGNTQNISPSVRLEQMIEAWLQDTGMVVRTNSLLVQEVDAWVAREQQQILVQSIDGVNTVQRKRVL